MRGGFNLAGTREKKKIVIEKTRIELANHARSDNRALEKVRICSTARVV